MTRRLLLFPIKLGLAPPGSLAESALVASNRAHQAGGLVAARSARGPRGPETWAKDVPRGCGSTGLRFPRPIPRRRRARSPSEVADLLGVPKTWVYEQSRTGRIPTVNLGRYRRYRREAIGAWVEQLEGSSQVAEGLPAGR